MRKESRNQVAVRKAGLPPLLVYGAQTPFALQVLPGQAPMDGFAQDALLTHAQLTLLNAFGGCTSEEIMGRATIEARPIFLRT